MSKEKLNNLIDKVIGKVGPLRVPAYWMNKTLKDIGEWVSATEEGIAAVDSKVDKTKASIPTKVSQLENDVEYATVNDVWSVYDIALRYEEGSDVGIIDALPFKTGIYNSVVKQAIFNPVNDGEFNMYLWLDKDSSLSLPGTDFNFLPEVSAFGCYRLSFIGNNLQHISLMESIPTNTNGLICATYNTSDSSIPLFTNNSELSAYINGLLVLNTQSVQIPYETKVLIKVKGREINNFFSGNSNLKKLEVINLSKIGADEFLNCSNLESVNIPDSVTSINSRAFKGCTNLKQVAIGDGISSLESDTFSGCVKLEEIYLGKSISSMEYPFSGTYNNLHSIYVNQDLETFANIEYSDISNKINYLPLKKAKLYLKGQLLEHLALPEGVTEIKNWFLYGYSSLKSITIPSSVSSYYYNAFQGCEGVIKIDVDANNKILDSRENCNCIISTSSNSILRGCKRSVIPESITRINNEAFFLVSFDDPLTIPSAVLEQGSKAFQFSGGPALVVNCNISDAYSLRDINGVFCASKFDKVTLNSNRIGAYAFYNSDAKEVLFTDKVTSIGIGAFDQCRSVQYYDFSSHTHIPNIGSNVFRGNSDNCKIIVPDVLYDQWVAATNWSTVADRIIKKSDWDAQNTTE